MSGDASKGGGSKLNKTLQNIKQLRGGSAQRTEKTLKDLADMKIDDAAEIEEVLVSEFAKLRENDPSSSESRREGI